MGDYCVADHFVVGERPVPTPAWYDRKKGWAMRAGVVAPGVQLLQTVEKWSCQRLAGPGVVGVCAAYDYLSGGPCGAFVAGCNYLLAPGARDDRLFLAAAEELGDGARVASAAGQRALCLNAPVLYRRPIHRWRAPALPFLDEPLARLAAVVARTERALSSSPTELIAGLWTPDHGFVHSGCLTLAAGTIEWEVSGRYNLLHAAWRGPYAGLLFLQSHQRPVRVALQRWPFDG
jgi:hypothetical protein